jgi:basic membrane protein A and related proteins
MKRALLILILVAGIGLSSGCAAKATNCADTTVFCVGLVTDLGRLEDRSYNQAAWEGVQQAKSSGTADSIASIETVDLRDFEANIQVFTDAKYDEVVTVGADMTAATLAAAQANPDIYFIGVDQDQTANQEFSPNLVGLVFPEDQIGYLAGVLAASLTKTGQIGAVLGSDASPSMQRYGQGFINGAASIDPTITPKIVYHNDVSPDKSLSDPEWGAEQANTLVDGEVDIVFGAGGSTGINALIGAVMRGAYAIGSDIDEYYALPVAAPHLYTSAIKLIKPAVASLIEAARNAQNQTAGFPSGNFEGQVGLAPYHDLETSVPDELKVKMTTLVENLQTGDVQTGVP